MIYLNTQISHHIRLRQAFFYNFTMNKVCTFNQSFMKYLYSFIIFISVLFLATCSDETSSSNTSKSLTDSNQDPLQKGKMLAFTTFATLSSNLQNAMQEGGVPNAVKYCNLSAAPIVDSLQNLYQATIKRTSLKTRNPDNQPSEIELQQLHLFQNQMKADQELAPVIRPISKDKVAYFAPIHVSPLCQKCHGKIGDSLNEQDYKTIQHLYPQDKAIGYEPDDLRGMWSITFAK